MRARRWIGISLLVAVVALMGAACRPIPPGGPKPLLDAPLFAGDGPFEVGVTTLALADREVEVWYPTTKWATSGTPTESYFIRDFLPEVLQALIPADINPPYATDAHRDVRPVPGRFPLVLFSHGANGYRLQSTELTTHLASWGYVVASPDFLERGLQQLFQPPLPAPKTNVQVLRETVDRVKAAVSEPGGLLQHAADTRRVVPVGHSAGGFASTQFAAEPDAIGWISLTAGASSTTPLPAKPSMWIAGANDGIIPPGAAEAAFDAATPPTRFVNIGGTGHLNGFSDICEIGEGGGGVIALAKQAGLPIPPNLERLGTDGCFEPNLDSPVVWPVTHHFVVAQLRVMFDAKAWTLGLGDGVATRFPGVDVTYEQRLAG